MCREGFAPAGLCPRPCPPPTRAALDRTVTSGGGRSQPGRGPAALPLALWPGFGLPAGAQAPVLALSVEAPFLLHCPQAATPGPASTVAAVLARWRCGPRDACHRAP